jgi:hypothetical protein
MKGTSYEILITQFSPNCSYLIPLRPNILLSTLFSNILSRCSSFNVRDQVSHPYRTADKIIVLYILIFTFLEYNINNNNVSVGPDIQNPKVCFMTSAQNSRCDFGFIFYRSIQFVEFLHVFYSFGFLEL